MHIVIRMLFSGKARFEGERETEQNETEKNDRAIEKYRWGGEREREREGGGIGARKHFMYGTDGLQYAVTPNEGNVVREALLLFGKSITGLFRVQSYRRIGFYYILRLQA